ncbi:MAG: hypothetical protein RMK64_08205 [Rhodovarius sp.]|nr:hypothetical protein [Rhodovarius sp.]MCX7931502.1 hypothetical protein [Rhodovarius sp.]MDW8314938.1 hypothetical protein [Rhodovarius sp.]
MSSGRLDDAALTRAVDLSIRRALAFAALAIATTMLALSYDVALAFSVGAQLLAVMTLVMAVLAWHAPRRELRDSEAWTELLASGQTGGRRLAEVRPLLAAKLQERLNWHAERLAVATLALACLGLLLRALKSLM